MATLSYQQASPSGTTQALVAASAGGDVIPVNERGCLLVKNGGGSSITVTVAVPGNTKYGLATPDPAVVVAAGATAYIGPVYTDLADSTDGMAHFTYSGVTSVTVGGVQI